MTASGVQSCSKAATEFFMPTVHIAVKKLLRKKYPFSPIFIVLDNAAYQRCKKVKDFAAELSISLVFLPLTIYSLHWNIEVSFYEMKKFWSLEDYMLRSKIGIERLTNLLMIVYSLMTLLPFYDSLFFPLADKSPQETRFLIDRQIQQELFFATFEIQPTSSKINFSSFFACAG